MNAAAAALALALLGVGCCGAPAPYTVRRTLSPDAALGPPPAPAPAVRALLVGDFGDRTCQQEAVARGVAAAHRAAPYDVAFSLGDNLYECGPDPLVAGAAGCEFGPDGATVAAGFRPPPDPLFAAQFESRFPDLLRGGQPVPVFQALGNHDVAGCGAPGLDRARVGRLRACLEVAHRGPRWQMPARHYVVDRGPVRFIVLDTNLLVGPYGGFTIEGEVEFLRGATEGCDRRPCFVVGHHPAATAGLHRDDATPEYVERLRALQEAAGDHISGWFAGHDHDLQHLRAAAGYDVFISGNGARARPRERFDRVSVPGAQLLFASTSWGFASLEASASAWRVRFESADGEPLHCCHATFPGRCRPVACPPPAAARSDAP